MSSPGDSVVVSEPPDDDVEIGESPDGSRLSGDEARHLLTNRRSVLVALGSLATIAAIAEADPGGGDGTLYGGTMALDNAYKVGARTYMGPDSVKDSVISEIPDEEGWRYEATDTNVQYWLDDNTWVGPQGLGSESKSAGPVYTERVRSEGTYSLSWTPHGGQDGIRLTGQKIGWDGIPSHTLFKSQNDILFKNGDGSWRTVDRSADGVESGAIPIGSEGSTGDVTISVSASLRRDPSGEELSARIVSPSVSDWSGYVKSVEGTGWEEFEVTVHIESLSSTSGATADLAWEAKDLLKPEGERTFVVNDESENGFLQQAFVGSVSNNTVLTFTGDDGSYDAHTYLHPGMVTPNIKADSATENTNIDNVSPPLWAGGDVFYDESSSSDCALFGEYTLDGHDPGETRIIRWEFGQGFEVALSLPTPDYRHWQSLQRDPFNEGHFYGTTGDGGQQCSFWKSTDWGRTWTEVGGGQVNNVTNPEAQKWRTLNLCFTKDHIYWTTDGWAEGGYCKLLRCQRGSEDNPETVADLSSDYLSYGACRVYAPNGILCTVRNEGSAMDQSSIPIWFYDINNGELVDRPEGALDTEEDGLYRYSIDTDEGNRPGVMSIQPYQHATNGGGGIYAVLEGWEQAPIGEERTFHELGLSKLMGTGNQS